MKKKRAIPNHLRVVRERPPEVEAELSEFTPEAVRNAYIVRFGPTCAAWLVRDLDRRRKASRRLYDGTFAMHLPAGAEEPAWFQIAVGFLKRRSRWSVVLETCRGDRRYRLHFFGPTSRELPPALRRVK